MLCMHPLMPISRKYYIFPEVHSRPHSRSFVVLRVLLLLLLLHNGEMLVRPYT